MSETGRKIRVLGLMSGTSCDGLDAACLEFGPHDWKLLWHASKKLPSSLRQRIFNIQDHSHHLDLSELLRLDRDLGHWYGKSLNGFLKKHPAKKPHAIANHGQTVAHYPPVKGEKGTTLQLGNPHLIAAQTGLTVLDDFRRGDQAVGGEGAPLAPLFHMLLARSLKSSARGVAIHNLGGVSNLTYFFNNHELLASDTGPANLWIDEATRVATHHQQNFDTHGKKASRGKIDTQAVQKALRLPFFRKQPPKSTGRDDFPPELFFQLTGSNNNDLIATAVEITAQTIGRAYQNWILKKRYPLKEIIFSGGGAKNSFLLERIQRQLPGPSLKTTQEAFGLPPELIEASAFAFLGFLSLWGGNLGGKWTKQQSTAPSAALVPGTNWRNLFKRLDRFANAFPAPLKTDAILKELTRRRGPV